MTTPDFTTTILVDKTPEEAFSAIKNISGWWSENIEGSTNRLDDEFIYHYKDIHYCKLKLIELMPNQKVVWQVLDNYFKFTEDKGEWKGTKLIFDISQKDGQESLFGYLEKERGLPGAGIHAWLASDGKIYKGKIYTRDQLSTEMTGDLLLDVKETKVEQILSAYSVSLFNGEVGKPRGDYYMLLNNEPGLLDLLQNFVSQTSMN